MCIMLDKFSHLLFLSHFLFTCTCLYLLHRWSTLLKKANNLFLPGVSLSQHCCHHAVSLDYFPALRTLGRAEQLRLATYTRRANRYFSYLKGLGIHANKSFKDLMCDCFSDDCL